MSPRRLRLSVVAAAVLFGTLGLGLAAPSTARAGWLSHALRLDKLKDLGVIATVGLEYSLPGLPVGGSADVGFKLTPLDPTIGRHRFAPFAVATGSAVVASYSAVGSTRRKWCGFERFVGVVGRGHPVYGDRVSIPILPGILSLSASRSGGFGVSFSLIPLPFHLGGALAHPFLRGSAQLYITHPKLAKFSNKLLDRVDLVTARIKRATRPAVIKFKWRILRPLKRKWNALVHPTRTAKAGPKPGPKLATRELSAPRREPGRR